MSSKTNSKKIIAVLIVLIVILAAAGITIVAYLINASPNQQNNSANLSGVVFDNNASHYDETVADRGGEELGIKIPGYSNITIPSDSDNIPITLLNPEGNPCNFKFTLEVEETGEKLCTTDYVKPGDAINGAALNNALPKGSYTLIINIKTSSVDTGAEMNGAQVKTHLDVV